LSQSRFFWSQCSQLLMTTAWNTLIPSTPVLSSEVVMADCSVNVDVFMVWNSEAAARSVSVASAPAHCSHWWCCWWHWRGMWGVCSRQVLVIIATTGSAAHLYTSITTKLPLWFLCISWKPLLWCQNFVHKFHTCASCHILSVFGLPHMYMLASVLRIWGKFSRREGMGYLLFVVAVLVAWYEYNSIRPDRLS